ncbi:retrovirus-related Pol polyprotein from transposon opus [Trichonephila clavipes]|nr:retrovirus-related Pol polyprotein from transposon opus [Trichonephila clavipes]
MHVRDKVSNLLVNLGEEELKDYESLKQVVLKEYEPSPKICFENFRKAKRNSDETFSSVRDPFNIDVVILLRSTHIGVLQGEEWYKPRDLGKQCDIFYASKGKSYDEPERAKWNDSEKRSFNGSWGKQPFGRKSIFGPAVKCPLVYVPIGLATGGQVNVVHQQVLCALAEVLVEDVLLPPDVLDMLGGAQSEENSLAQSSQDLRVDSGNVDETEVSSGILPEKAQEHIEDSQRNITSCRNEVGTLGTKDEEVTAEMDKGIMVADSFRSEQECCAELALVWKYAKEGKGNYYEVDGYLFRRDKILGESIGQLVILKCRRTEVLKLAHTSVFSSHMGPKKTIERIKYSFFWEGLRADVKKFCESCKECQLTRSVRIKDRPPITPVARPELPFEVGNMDLIGPIDPPSLKGHKYILCLVDQHTRWGEAMPLTSLSAKVTCEALLSIFSRTGIPNVVASDNGTNFAAELTKEFEKRIGSSPRFSTPGYPQSNGLVERFNRTLKNKPNDVSWGEAEQNSFVKLKELLCEVTSLATPDANLPFQVHCDASDYGVGCCLIQQDTEGIYRPIAFASQKFNATQKNWASIEKEAWAVLYGLNKFDKWIYGAKVEIISDHNPLKYLNQTTPKSTKLTRWALALQRWNHPITHRPGIQHRSADALSRLR